MKRARPCQHYRRIKTKKGIKRKLINKGRQRKVRKRRDIHDRPLPFWREELEEDEKNYGFFRSKKEVKKFGNIRSPHPVAETQRDSPETLKRKIREHYALQEEKEMKELKAMEAELEAERRKSLIAMEDEREGQLRAYDEKIKISDEKIASKLVGRKLKEFRDLGLKLERKRKNNTKLAFFNKYNLDQKLDRAADLAQESGDDWLKGKVKDFRRFFDSEITENMKLESAFKKGEMTKDQKKLFKLGKKMLDMPEVKKPTILSDISPAGKFDLEFVPQEYHEEMKEARKFEKQQAKTRRETAEEIKRQERLGLREAHILKQDVAEFAEKALREGEKDAGFSRKQKEMMEDKMKELKEKIKDAKKR